MWIKEDNISNISCPKIRDYFSLQFYTIVGRRAAGVQLSICRPGPGLSGLPSSVGCRAAGENYAKGTVITNQ